MARSSTKQKSFALKSDHARRLVIIGNWKMNGDRRQLAELAAVADGLKTLPAVLEVALCPPFPLIGQAVRRARGSPLMIGAQDCHSSSSGPFTGDVSGDLLKEMGARFVLLGHSERRRGHGETDEIVRAKAQAALRAGLVPVICVGEDQRGLGPMDAARMVAQQVSGSVPETGEQQRLIIAYEPAWAIGRGEAPAPSRVAKMIAAVLHRLEGRDTSSAAAIQVVYGGSVTAANAGKLLRVRGLDGLLVGGASLTAKEFLPILAAAAHHLNKGFEGP